MTQATRQALTLSGLAILGGLAIATELHRHILAFLWPIFTGFLDTYITF
jgi:hypothetical protein